MTKYTVFTVLLIINIAASAQLANWTGYKANKFPTNQSGQIHGQARIAQMKFHPTNPNIMYAITPQGGLFISTDQAANWTSVGGTDAITAKCASICIDYTNDQILYLGGGDPNYYNNGAGIYKSTNGGATFTQLTGGLPTNRIVDEIIMHPTDNNTLVAATNGGIYKSTNGGTTWTAKTSTSLQFCDMKRVANATSKTLFATTQTTTPEFYRSTDFGDTWTLISSGLSAPTIAPLSSGSRVAVTPADTNVVYFSMVASGGIIYKSMDNGLTFIQKKAGGSPYLTFYNDNSTSSGQGNYNNCLGIDNIDPDKLWLQSHNTWYSSDGGTTWTMLTFWSQKVHTDMHQINKSPYDNTKLYSCNDGGVWLSTDEGNNWTPKSDGIYAYEITATAGKSSATRRDFVSIGTQDNGGLYADSTGWYTVSGGDDYTPRELDKRSSGAAVYYIGRTGDFSVSNIGKRRLTPTASRTFYTSVTDTIYGLAFNRKNINLAFLGNGKLGDGNIYRSTDVQSASPTWTKISTFDKTIKAVHSCIADTNRLYVLTSDQKIYVSTNALSATPTFTMYALPSATNTTATVTAICNNADIVYIAINNKVYRSGDGGATWANITYNLPSVNHRRILAEEYYGDEELVFVATNNAVYYKKAGQITWTNYSTGLPARQAPTDFSMYDDGSNQGLIRYTSYGRGLWETPFDNLRTAHAVMSVKASTDVCSDATWSFKDISIGAVSRTWSFPGASPATSTATNPTVTYNSSGTFVATLTITDALSNNYVTTYNVIVTDINKCDADTITGNALQLDANTDYATIPAFNITRNTITLMAWIKPNGTQSATTGLIFSGSGGATGMNLTSNGRLGYHWANTSGSYNYVGGPIVPVNVWSHVALVVTGTDATFYLNGVPTVRTATHAAVNFNTAFQIGRDRTSASRNFIGKMDEVAIYDSALSINEVREQMHLTKKPTTDPHLLAYFQMNEPNGTILLDHAHSYHGALVANATRSTSTAPFGGGVSERQSITNGGLKSFNTPGVDLTFPATGTYPNGEIVVSRINVSPDQKPSATTSPENAYWIIDNYGSNSTFSQLSSITFRSLPTIGNGGYIPSYFYGYKRSNISDGNTWGANIDQADVLTPTTGQNADLTFSTGNAITSFGQFSIENTVPCIMAPPTITISNPATAGNSISLCAGSVLTLTGAGTGATATEFAWFRNGIFVSYSNSSADYTFATLLGTNTYTLVVIYNGSCPSAVSNSISVTGIAPTVIITPSIAGPYCVGSAPVLDATPPTGTGYTYSWICNSGCTSASNSTFTPTASGNHRVIITDANGCSKSSPWMGIVLNALPNAVAGTDKVICENGTVSLGATAVAGYTYQWLPSTYLSNAAISNPTISNAGIGTIDYILSVTKTVNGCSKKDTVKVNVLPNLATPILNSTASPVCQGTSITLSPANVTGAVNWYKNGALFSSTTTATAKVFSSATANPDSYTIRAKNTTCLSDLSNTASVMIHAAPNPTITATPTAVGNIVSICNSMTSGTANLMANVPQTAPTLSAYNWQQIVAGAGQSVANTSTYAANVALSPTSQNNKVFRVQVTYSNNCTKKSGNITVKMLPPSCALKLGNNQDAIGDSEAFEAYPNPTQDILHVVINNCKEAEGKLTICNSLGQIIATQNIVIVGDKVEEVMNLSHFSPGIYSLSFQTQSSHYIKKIIVE